MAARIYTAQELSAFEREMKVSLPEDYKRYLMDVGAGELTRSKISHIEDWCQPNTPEELPAGQVRQQLRGQEGPGRGAQVLHGRLEGHEARADGLLRHPRGERAGPGGPVERSIL